MDINDRIKDNYSKKNMRDYHKYKNKNEKSKKKYILKSGLNNLKYKILREIKINEYTKKIIVNI